MSHFLEFFAEEGDAFFGGSFVTGLLWAMESLAWSGDYLIRVCSILANLSSVDPGGQWSNRPANSLVTILLPWLPQTVGDSNKRYSALQAIARDHTDVAWKLLLDLLPKRHSTSSHTHRPKWRNFIPEDWKDGVTVRQYWKDVAFYANLALELAGNDPARLVELISFYFELPPKISNFAEALRERLQSDAILALPEDQRLEIWTKLTTKTINHRKYADSDAWSVPEDALKDLDAVADKIKPEEPEIRHKRLFSGRDMDLYDESGNWEEQRSRLLQRRIEALREILDRGGIDNLRSFWRSVEAPHEVGNAYGADAERADDTQILPTLLESEIEADLRFSVSYIWRRFFINQWAWVDSIDRSSWSSPAKAKFFAALPFVNEIWERVTIELSGTESEYWTRAQVHPDRDHLERIEFAIVQLIKNGRSDSAIECFWIGNLWGGEYSELGLQALETFSEENHIDTHTIEELFNHLQRDETIDENRLADMEVKFLGLLNRFGSAQPRTLYRHLAERPNFFCDVIRMIYRSTQEVDDMSDKEPEIEEDTRRIAERAYRLLMDWDHPPGLQPDGTFDAERLYQWVKKVKAKCIETGHWDVASTKIGEVLFYAPRDMNGLWLESVCELLDSKEDPDYRRGLEIRIFNSRGVYGFSGGKEEVELAEKWERVADHADSKGFSRLATTLRELAKSYREEAKRSVSEHRNRYD